MQNNVSKLHESLSISWMVQVTSVTLDWRMGSLLCCPQRKLSTWVSEIYSIVMAFTMATWMTGRFLISKILWLHIRFSFYSREIRGLWLMTPTCSLLLAQSDINFLTTEDIESQNVVPNSYPRESWWWKPMTDLHSYFNLYCFTSKSIFKVFLKFPINFMDLTTKAFNFLTCKIKYREVIAFFFFFPQTRKTLLSM